MSNTSSSGYGSRGILFALALIIALGLYLRIVDLGGKCFWCDEVHSYERANWDFKERIVFLIKNSAHLPLYESILHLWLLGGKSDAFARFPSVIFGTLSILITWQLFKTISNQRIALLSALFLAVSPLHVMFSRIVREYSLLCFLSIVSTLLFIKLIEKREKGQKNRLWLPYFTVTLLLIYTHYYAWFIILSQNIYLFITRVRHKHLLRAWFLTQAALVLLLLPWLLGNLNYLLGEDCPRTYYCSMFGRWVKMLFMLFTFSIGLTVYPWNFKIVIPAVIGFSYPFVLSIRYFLHRHSRHINGHLLIVLPFMVPLLIGILNPACAPRQLLGSLPFFYAIIATGIFEIRRTWVKAAVSVLIFIVSLLSLQNYFTDQEFVDVDMITPWNRIAEDISTSAYDTDNIILVTLYPTNFYHYYKGPSKIVYQIPDSWHTKYPEIYRGEFVIHQLEGYEDFKTVLEKSPRAWVLVVDNCKMSKTAEDWLKHKNAAARGKYQLEEHTLKGLRESWANRHKYRSYMYRLYLYEKARE